MCRLSVKRCGLRGPSPAAPPVRMPFDRSRQERERRREENMIEIPEILQAHLLRIAERG